MFNMVSSHDGAVLIYCACILNLPRKMFTYRYVMTKTVGTLMVIMIIRRP